MPLLSRMVAVAALAGAVLAAPHAKRCDATPTVPVPAPPATSPTLIPNPIPVPPPTPSDVPVPPPADPAPPPPADPAPPPPADPAPPPPEGPAPPPPADPAPPPPADPAPPPPADPAPPPPADPAPPPPADPAPPPPDAPAPDPNLVCNGDARLCDRKFSDVVFLGSHDSYAVEGAGGIIGVSDVASNQYIDIPSQLGMGVRFLQAQTHVKDDTLHVCHTSCNFYDGGSVEDYFKTINGFLQDEKNRNEVLTLLVTNNDGYDLGKWADIFKSSGLESLVYTPPSLPDTRDKWPTMRELITANTRVVVLMDYTADLSKVPYIIPEFDVMWESHYDETDKNFPCAVDRVNGDASGKLGLINHYLDLDLFGALIPDRLAADTTNSVDSVNNQVNNCKALGDNFKVSHVLLDWIDKGQAMEAGRKLNGLE